MRELDDAFLKLYTGAVHLIFPVELEADAKPTEQERATFDVLHRKLEAVLRLGRP
jgi:hypothetical protein